jgi:hypothetical protein
MAIYKEASIYSKYIEILACMLLEMFLLCNTLYHRENVFKTFYLLQQISNCKLSYTYLIYQVCYIAK